MKLRILISTLAFIALFNIACDDDADNLGQKIQPTDDEIVVDADTFHLATETILVENLISKPDSFLLGKFQDDKYGTTEASILTELKLSKEGFTFLDDSLAVTQVDSLVLTMNLGSVFGNVSSPIHIGVYELKSILDRNTDYMSDLDITPFVDTNKDKLIGDTLLSIKDGITDTIAEQIRFHMSPEFTQRFFTTNPAHYKNQDAFRDFFKGVFITTEFFGSATMLNIRSITLSMYYNYAYTDNLNEKLYGQQDFHVTSEIKSVNQIIHPIRGFMPDPTNEFSQVSSPANHYTRVRIPIDRIYDRVKVPGKALDINSASVKINVKKNEAGSTHLPYVNNMLLIKENALKSFFDRRESLSDTCAFLATLVSTKVEEKIYDYSYSFSGLSALIEEEIKKRDKNESNAEYLEMVLVPVTTYTNSSGTLSEIKQSNLLQSSTLLGGNNKEKPMKIEIIYSGF